MLEDVLAFQERLTLWLTVPVPVRASVEVVGEALLVTVRVALTVPETCGLNVIVNGALWPAAIVTGSESPPILKTELFVLAAVTVTFAPLALSVPDADPLFPTATLPRFRVDGEIVSVPTAAVAVPDKEMVRVGFEAFEVMVTVPLALPVTVGANVTVNPVLCPAPKVKEELIPLRLNPVPLIETFVTETVVPPVLVIVPDKDWFEPTVTLPKLSELGLELS